MTLRLCQACGKRGVKFASDGCKFCGAEWKGEPQSIKKNIGIFLIFLGFLHLLIPVLLWLKTGFWDGVIPLGFWLEAVPSSNWWFINKIFDFIFLKLNGTIVLGVIGFILYSLGDEELKKINTKDK